MPAKPRTRKKPAAPTAPDASAAAAASATAAPRNDKQLLLKLKELIEDLIDQCNTPPVDEPQPVADTSVPAKPVPSGKGKLAIIVGHTADAPGAYGIAPIAASEYPWNSDLAKMIVTKAQAAGHACHVFFRDNVGIQGAYQQVEQWDPDAAIELHFNCAEGNARGTETLRGSQPEAVEWAQRVQDGMVSLYERTGSADRGIKRLLPGDRGHASVSQLDRVPTVLIEPFFGDETSDAKLGQDTKKQLAEALADAFDKFMSEDASPDLTGGAQPSKPVKPDEIQLPADVRLKMGMEIVNSEARRDSAGRIAVYRLPAADGGGTYEVAGINDRYHPEKARQLRDLIAAGKQAEAERAAAEYIVAYTDRVGTWVSDPAVQFYLRDSAFNRGLGGAAKILQLALGVPVDGGVGPITKGAIAAMEKKNDPAGFLKLLRDARETYERKYIGYRSIFWRGLTNRWNNALAFSSKLLGGGATRGRTRGASRTRAIASRGSAAAGKRRRRT